jgi:N6-adenosine-specific RNA methylase IME4
MPDGTPRLPTEPAATFHPAANIFPLMTGVEFDALVADIKARGLVHPIVEIGNTILDGRNRYLACNQAGVRIRTVKYTGNDPVGYVLSANLERRHLNEGQRAMVAARMANMGEGRPEATSQIRLVSQAEAAERLSVGISSVKQAKVVRNSRNEALIARVDAGEVAVSLAATIAKLPPEDQADVLRQPEAKMATRIKLLRRVEREVGLASATRAASAAIGSKLYGVIYADPPWRFEPYSRETGLDRSADNHYPTMTIDALRVLAVPAADNAVLFLWATVPMLPEALSVMEAWGFAYKSHCAWIKDQIGTGYWFRNAHELLLVGTRGDVPAPAPGTQYASYIQAAVGPHSAKPAVFAEMIEELFPSADLLEMFARGTRAGWDTWGNEAP